MDIIIKAVSIGFASFLLSFLISLCVRHSYDREARVVKYPKPILIVGIVSFVVFFVPTVVTLFLDVHIMFPVSFSIFALLSTFLIFAWVNCKIFYDDEKITVQNLFRQKKTFTYDKIVGFKILNAGFRLYFEKGKISVDNLSIGNETFFGFARAKYREIYGAPIPSKK